MFPIIHKHKTMTAFFLFSVIYLTLIVLFSAIYLILELTGTGNLKEHYLPHQSLSMFDLIGKCLYFSLVTNLSVGFGDITPFGIARLFASMQAFIGYLLPVALVIHLFPNEVKEAEEDLEEKAKGEN
ncbi:potassium channel family protein [Metabacillus sp. GX 13764]|uniref:ion channel n=1 Tax=Metabacillus kandeliae TaxID=2900151 RepID=UPI001E593737|nr:ion channel [Metabacillus kandeliae]MCD7036358.1 potassium channel family protein [Metabacillus kandeliae]